MKLLTTQVSKTRKTCLGFRMLLLRRPACFTLGRISPNKQTLRSACIVLDEYEPMNGRGCINRALHLEFLTEKSKER